MFKIKCGDKYFKKVYLEDDEADKMMDPYVDEAGFHYLDFENENMIYKPCGVITQILLVDDLEDVYIFDSRDLTYLRRERWFHDFSRKKKIQILKI